MQTRSRIQTTGPNNGHQLWDNSKSYNRSENRPLILDDPFLLQLKIVSPDCLNRVVVLLISSWLKSYA